MQDAARQSKVTGGCDNFSGPALGEHETDRGTDTDAALLRLRMCRTPRLTTALKSGPRPPRRPRKGDFSDRKPATPP